jgi:DNA primase large subunit
LLTKAMAFTKAQEQDKELRERYGSGKYREDKEFEQFQTAAPEELFPPCMQLVLQGMKDGKKRAMFVLINFLASVGWQPDAIEKKLDEWNVKNAEVQEQLRETILKGRLRYHKQQSKTQKPLLPPNCLNKTYYVDMGVCKPDGLCAKIKNPVQYVKKKMWLAQQGEKKERPKRVMRDEQKQRMQAARKQYKEFREMMKKKKAGDVVESA